jgi:ribonuclease J
MRKKSSLNPQKLYFIPLGGAGEIGANLNVYSYDGKLLIVDIGVSFEKLPGAEVIMPSLSFLKEQAKNIKGIIITHAHEDHIGAVGHLWPELQCPIYATPFTARFAEHKLREQHIKARVTHIPLSGTVDLDPFKVRFVELTHSILEPNALAIETPKGTILHTGDWKIDHTPVMGKITDKKTLKALGKKGILAAVCDSTSVFEKGWSGSEETVKETLIQTVKDHPDNRVVVACFASNAARLLSCYKAAQATGRRMALVGRSLDRIDRIIRDSGYFDDMPPFLTEKETKNISPSKLLIVCTGSQGEPRAALMRIANKIHPRVALDAGDVVIFSSRIIPGNEKSIYALQNQLVRRGIDVITAKDIPNIHVSGHPSQDELKEMYSWLKPKSVIPVHGEDRHIDMHAQLARAWGVKHTICPRNGDIICIDEEIGPQKVGEVVSGHLALDGRRLISVEGNIFKERERLSVAGIICISLVLNAKNHLTDCQISELGVQEPDEHEEFVDTLGSITQRSFNRLRSEERDDEDAIEGVLVKDIHRYCQDTIGKKPYVFFHIMRP